MIIRDSLFYKTIILFKCAQKAKDSNCRFTQSVNKEEIAEMLFKYDFKCFYCNEKLNSNDWQLDHFHPRANGGLNNSENLVPTCKWCNTMKNALDGHAFINKCFNILNNNFFARNGLEQKFEDKEINLRVARINRKLKKLNFQGDEDFTLFLKEAFTLYNNR